MTDPEKSYTYEGAGVSIAAGNALVKAIGPLVRATARPGADAELGGFGAFFDPKAAGFKDPLLVAANDGVGTKLKLAIDHDRHDSVGIDLVAMCVNDLIVQGAEPLFFLDYFATGALESGIAERVIAGIADGCKQAGCALIGGETAEMPGMYAPGDYDLAGFCVGAVERGAQLTGQRIAPGHVLIGLASSGVHSNGFSLVRRLAQDKGWKMDRPALFDQDRLLVDHLMEPTRIYVGSLLPLIRDGLIDGLAHITGAAAADGVPPVAGQYRARGTGPHLQLRHRHGADGGTGACRGGYAAASGRWRNRLHHRRGRRRDPRLRCRRHCRAMVGAERLACRA